MKKSTERPVSIIEILDALCAAHEDAQDMMKPHTAADDLPFDVLPAILSEDYNALVQALLRFSRDISAIYAYAHGLPPLEYEIIDRHTDAGEKKTATALKEQFNEWIYLYTEGEADA